MKTPGNLREFAGQYTAAWCSQDAARVAAFYAEQGSLTINGGARSVGRGAIQQAAQEFMTAFPDMKVLVDALEEDSGHPIFRWTLIGTNTGPGGSGRRVLISGYEEWTIGPDGLIQESQGHFDAEDYRRQELVVSRRSLAGKQATLLGSRRLKGVARWF